MSIACVRKVGQAKGGVCRESLSHKTGYRNNSHKNSVSVATAFKRASGRVYCQKCGRVGYLVGLGITVFSSGSTKRSFLPIKSERLRKRA